MSGHPTAPNPNRIVFGKGLSSARGQKELGLWVGWVVAWVWDWGCGWGFWSQGVAGCPC